MAQQVVWYLTVALVIFIAVTFAFVAIRAKSKSEYAPIQKKGYRLRTYYFIVLIVFMLIAFSVTMAMLPYDQPANAGQPVIVQVNGFQFAWELDKHTVEVGQLVQFQVTSSDVNHGFGIYDEQMKLVAQTQAMPGFTNRVFHTFTEAGTYRVLCMEYCGLGHHIMVDEIHVVAQGGHK